jgi:hypothetical protein
VEVNHCAQPGSPPRRPGQCPESPGARAPPAVPALPGSATGASPGRPGARPASWRGRFMKSALRLLYIYMAKGTAVKKRAWSCSPKQSPLSPDTQWGLAGNLPRPAAITRLLGAGVDSLNRRQLPVVREVRSTRDRTYWGWQSLRNEPRRRRAPARPPQVPPSPGLTRPRRVLGLRE